MPPPALPARTAFTQGLRRAARPLQGLRRRSPAIEIAAIAALALMSAPHCAAMCGPLAACATGCDRRRHAGYQLGRLGGYAIAGAIAGGLGGVPN
jgi:hypothetical protein